MCVSLPTSSVDEAGRKKWGAAPAGQFKFPQSYEATASQMEGTLVGGMLRDRLCGLGSLTVLYILKVLLIEGPRFSGYFSVMNKLLRVCTHTGVCMNAPYMYCPLLLLCYNNNSSSSEFSYKHLMMFVQFVYM